MSTDTNPDAPPTEDLPGEDPTPFTEQAPSMRWEGDGDARAKLVAAIAAASLDFGNVERSMSGQIGNRRFDYAPLIQYTKATRKALASQGVVCFQGIHTSPFATPQRRIHRLTTEVRGHGAGLIVELDFRPPRSTSGKVDDSSEVKDTVEWGKLTTYLRRYSYATTFVLDGDPDLDEAGSEAPRPEPAKNRQPPAPQQAKAPPSRPAPQREQPKAAPKPAPAQRQAELERTLSTPVASNGSGAPVGDDGDPGPEPPPDLAEEPRVEPDIPEDIRAMDDATLKVSLKGVAMELFGKVENPREAAQKRCLELTGKPREECTTRADLERLLAGLRADLAAAA